MTMNRRQFLQAASAAAVAGAFSFPAFAAPGVLPEKWDEEYDVVVIGSGFAGLAAAIEASDAGASVVILEKMRTPGGNSIINGGIMAVPGSPEQAAQGIKDSPELMMKDMLKAGGQLNHPEKVRFLCDHAVDTYHWAVEKVGCRFQSKRIKQEGGHSVPRSLFTENGSGSAIVTKELAYLEKKGLKPRTRCFAQTFLRDTDGRVKGVLVRDGYRFPKADSGKLKAIRARKGVVLAYGGFAADAKYRQIFDPKLTDKFDTTNQPGATSESWREASRIGCQMIQSDWIQILPQTSPDEKGFGIGFAWSGHVSMFGLWVDAKTGKRFVNELANRKVRADAILNVRNMGHDAIAIGDSGTAKSFEIIRPGMLKRELDRKCVFKCETLEEVAKRFGVPVEELQKSVATVNDSVKTRKDVMGRPVNKDMQPLGTGPWYVARMSPKIHHCMGGLLTNLDTQVIDVEGKPIPGLYAAGEATGGVHGQVRLGSCAVIDCLTNGRIAGQMAAKNASWM